MEVAFSGINIYSKKPEAVFEFYKKLGFRVLEAVSYTHLRDEVYESIVAAGIACKPPFTAVWGGRELILHDPEGNELLFL